MKRFSEMEEQGESYATVDSETSESDSDDEVFHEEELVVISSTDKINMLQWSEHLEENWDRLIKESTRLLVLAGVHGREDGEPCWKGAPPWSGDENGRRPIGGRPNGIIGIIIGPDPGAPWPRFASDWMPSGSPEGCR